MSRKKPVVRAVDPDPTIFLNADPDPAVFLVRIRIYCTIALKTGKKYDEFSVNEKNTKRLL